MEGIAGAAPFEVAEITNVLVGAHNLVAKKVMKLSNKTDFLIGCCLTLSVITGILVAELKEHNRRIEMLEKQIKDIQQGES